MADKGAHFALACHDAKEQCCSASRLEAIQRRSKLFYLEAMGISLLSWARAKAGQALWSTDILHVVTRALELHGMGFKNISLSNFKQIPDKF